VYAIFETGGKQYKASKGDIVFVEKLDGEPGKLVSFDALVVADGDDIKIGTPIVEGAKVRAKIVEHGKEKKVVMFKYKPKRNYRKKQGHRQPFTKIRITSVGAGKEKEEAAEE
jgi:large subunit ribosomal protein L21